MSILEISSKIMMKEISDESNDIGSVTDDEIMVSGIASSDRKQAHHESSVNNNGSEAEAELTPNMKQAVGSPNVSKRRRNEAPIGFPQTVRSLTCTGIFDGVPVKYISTSGQELCGIIKGSGYLCGCEECKFSKVLQAEEFERHAGYKTKHPNCRVYFKNGKTIYRVVQKLRGAPENLLFEKIQTATGSPINQKAFSAWKDSFQSASYNLGRTEVVGSKVQ